MSGEWVVFCVLTPFYVFGVWMVRRQFRSQLREVERHWREASRMWEVRAMEMHRSMISVAPHIHTTCCECYAPIGGGPDEGSMMMEGDMTTGKAKFYCLPCGEKLPDWTKVNDPDTNVDYWQGPT